MSSVQEKEQIPKIRRKFLIRKSSLEKIRCTLNHSLLGSIFTKSFSLIRLVEAPLVSSKAVAHKMIILVIPAVHVILVGLTICVKLLTELNGKLTFKKTNQLKSKRQSFDKEIKTANLNENDEKISSEFDNQKQIETRVDDETFYDCLDIKNETEIKSKLPTKPEKNLMLIASIYACFSILLIKGLILIYMLGQANLRPGLIFLLVCVLYLNFLVLKISFMKQIRNESSPSRLKQQKSRIIKNLSSTQKSNTKPIALIMPQIRKSRSRSTSRENFIKPKQL